MLQTSNRSIVLPDSGEDVGWYVTGRNAFQRLQSYLDRSIHTWHSLADLYAVSGARPGNFETVMERLGQRNTIEYGPGLLGERCMHAHLRRRVLGRGDHVRPVYRSRGPVGVVEDVQPQKGKAVALVVRWPTGVSAHEPNEVRQMFPELEAQYIWHKHLADALKTFLPHPGTPGQRVDVRWLGGHGVTVVPFKHVLPPTVLLQAWLWKAECNEWRHTC